MSALAFVAVIIPLLAAGTPVRKLDKSLYLSTDDLRFPQWSSNGVGAGANRSSKAESPTREEVWRVKLGDICQITRFPLPSSEPSRYLECLRPYGDEKQWPWSDKGIWVLRQCPPGQDFHLISSTCRSRRYIRRQQSMCGQNPTPQHCPQPQQQQYSVQPQAQMACQCPPSVSVCVCPQPQGFQPVPAPPAPPQQPGYGGGGRGGGGGGSMCVPVSVSCPQPPQPCPMASQSMQNAQAGGLCSWMLAPLAADHTSNKCFLQCVPAPGNAYCGRWVRMPCAPATIFDVNVQVCVHDPYNMPGQVPQYGQMSSHCQAGAAIGSCNVNMQCPGQSVCQPPPQQSQQCQQQPQQCSMCCYTGGQTAGGGGGGGGFGGGYGGGGPGGGMGMGMGTMGGMGIGAGGMRYGAWQEMTK